MSAEHSIDGDAQLPDFGVQPEHARAAGVVRFEHCSNGLDSDQHARITDWEQNDQSVQTTVATIRLRVHTALLPRLP